MTGGPPRPPAAGAEPPGLGAAPAAPALGRPAPEEDRPGDPACWLRRSCPACGNIAETDPPTICPACQADMPGD